MKCTKEKTIFNLFEYFDCEGCAKYRKDECIEIGGNRVHFYWIHTGCHDDLFKNKKMYLLEIAFSKKLKLFLKDALISKLEKKNVFFIWLDDLDLNKNQDMELLYDLLEFDEDIYIIS